MLTETKNETFRVSHRWSRHELVSGPKDHRGRVLRGLARNDLLRTVSAYIEGYVEDFTVNHDDPFDGPTSVIQVCVSSVPVRKMVSLDERAELEALLEKSENGKALLRSRVIALEERLAKEESRAEMYRKECEAMWDAQNRWFVKLATRISGWFSR